MPNLNPLQEKLLEMLGWFHNFCVENGLRYYAIGGTTLGAVRHNGFIPWDDDVDVGLPRPDYERLKELAGEKINGQMQYFAEFPSDRKDFVYPYCKLYDTKTTLIESTKYKTKRGLYLDVFPLDGLNEKKEKHVNQIILYNEILCTRVCVLRAGRKWYKNASIVLARLIPDAIFPPSELIKKIDELCRQYPFDGSAYVGHLTNMISRNQYMERWIFGEPTPHPFENIVINIQEHSEKYLEHYYGDWRQLPPENKRVSNHDFISYDLNKPYIDL